MRHCMPIIGALKIFRATATGNEQEGDRSRVTRRDGWTTPHGRPFFSIKSCVQSTRSMRARAGGPSGSLVHLAPALLPGTGDCLLVDRYASASWRNHLDRQPRTYVDSSSGCPPWIDVRGLLMCLHRMVCWLQAPTIWKRVHRKFAC